MWNDVMLKTDMIEKAQCGDIVAFEHLYDLYKRTVYTSVYARQKTCSTPKTLRRRYFFKCLVR